MLMWIGLQNKLEPVQGDGKKKKRLDRLRSNLVPTLTRAVPGVVDTLWLSQAFRRYLKNGGAPRRRFWHTS